MGALVIIGIVAAVVLGAGFTIWLVRRLLRDK